MKKLILILFLIPLFTISQNDIRCGYQLIQKQNQLKDPNYIHRQKHIFQYAKQWAKENKKSLSQNQEILQIPVVVHILYENNDENISDDVINSQIDVLNEDFGRTNADTVETRAMFDSIAGIAKFKFHLATVDPDGNSTKGITRTSTTVNSFMTQEEMYSGQMLESMKKPSSGGVAPWPVEDYLNIWVCDISIDGQIGILGYASPPNNLPNWQGMPTLDPDYDGVVIHYGVFGRNAAPDVGGGQIVHFLGRVTTHEVGHYFGLRHIWGDSDNCIDDDGIDDTPRATQDGQNQCNHSSNTCVESPYNFPDMIENYMDYSAPSCQNMFTKGQVDFMYSVIVNNRSELPDSTTSGIFNSYINNNKEKIFAYPNPAQDWLTIDFNLINEVQSIQLFDVFGKLVWQEDLNVKQSHIQINLSTFSKGLYFAKVNALKSNTTLKIVLK
jgi:hypothetical protein